MHCWHPFRRTTSASTWRLPRSLWSFCRAFSASATTPSSPSSSPSSIRPTLSSSSALDGADGGNAFFQMLAFAHQFLGFFRIVPKIGIFGLFVQRQSAFSGHLSQSKMPPQQSYGLLDVVNNGCEFPRACFPAFGLLNDRRCSTVRIVQRFLKAIRPDVNRTCGCFNALSILQDTASRFTA